MRRATKTSITISALVILGAVFLVGSSLSAQDEKPKKQVYQATAMGQGTQMGRTASVTIIIEEFSTADDQQALMEAFQQKGMKGLTNALSKMKAKGRLAVTGTLGYDIAYARLFTTPTGRKVRIITDRLLRFGEVWADSRSTDYDLTALELDLSNEKGKDTGTLLPACQFKLDKENQVEIETFQNPWKLVNIQDRS
jgi:hypothetical protein